MYPKTVSLFLLLTIGLFAFPQRGRLLLVGGGSEKNSATGWNVPAYKWATQGKRVAVIGTSTGSLAPYLTQYCNAAYAREFAVSTRDSADSQVLYDTLMTYQVIFFRGGDQYEYYSTYKNTKLQQAAEQLFLQGGTLAGTSAGMHILSSVVFTAKNGTVYPYEAIENPNNSYMTLADDFMDLFPGYVFDTHFSERGRFGRLVGFLAKYAFDHQLNIQGLGMDDMTCMAVDTNNIGTVYGTGCANFYSYTEPFILNNTKLLHPGLQVRQLIQACTFNFNTGEVTTPTLNTLIETSGLEETGNFTLLASGGNSLQNNTSMLIDLATACGSTDDAVLILSGNESSGQAFADKLMQLVSAEVFVAVVNAAAGTDAVLANKISGAKKILFVANNTEGLEAFRASTNGILLLNRLKSPGIIAAFVGDDARFAGKTVVDNYYTELASWYGELEFSPGFGLLQHSMLMPNTFYNADIYENTATAVPYAMLRDSLHYGIWLSSKNYLKVQPVEGKTTLTGFGQHPVMILRNNGGWSGFVTQTGSGSNVDPRMEAGFTNLTFSLVDETLPYVMGNTNTSSVAERASAQSINLLQNPVQTELQLINPLRLASWTIFDGMGAAVAHGTTSDAVISIPVHQLSSGLYVIQVEDVEHKSVFSNKFIKR